MGKIKYYCSRLKEQNASISKELKEIEHKKRTTLYICGFILSFVMTGLLLIIYLILQKNIGKKYDSEMAVFLSIVSTIITFCLTDYIFNRISNKVYYRGINKKVKYYWFTKDFGNYVYIFSSSILFFLILLFINKLHIVLSIVLALLALIFNHKRLEYGFDLDSYIGGNYKKSEITYKTTDIKDEFGNFKGTAITKSYDDKYNGFETTDYIDKNGNYKGSSTTIKH